MTGLLALAFGAGLLAPVNPCGFGLLPAVLTATTATRPGTGNPVARLVAGLRAGLALTAGFTGTFTAIGLLLTVGVRSVITLVPWLAAALALAGIAMLAGWHPAVRITTNKPDTHQATSTRRLVTFGAGYAIASASCTLAVLLAVITQAAATTWVGVLAVFTAYVAGSALLLVTLALFAATAATLLTPIMRGVARYASRLAGALLALSGGYLLYYWLPQLLGAARPGDGLAALSVQVSTWISAHQLAVALTAATLALATAAAIVHARRTPATRTMITAATHCCPPASDQTAPAQPGATCYSLPRQRHRPVADGEHPRHAVELRHPETRRRSVGQPVKPDTTPAHQGGNRAAAYLQRLGLLVLPARCWSSAERRTAGPCRPGSSPNFGPSSHASSRRSALVPALVHRREPTGAGQGRGTAVSRAGRT